MDENELRSVMASLTPVKEMIDDCRDRDIYWPVIIALRSWHDNDIRIRMDDGRMATMVEVGERNAKNKKS